MQAKMKIMMKDLKSLKSALIQMKNKYKRGQKEVLDLKEGLREQKQLTKASVARERVVQRKIKTMIVSRDTKIDEKVEKMRLEMEKLVKELENMRRGFEKLKRERDLGETKIKTLQKKITDLETKLACKKQEAEIRKVELRKEAEEIKMQKEKARLAHSLRSDKEKAALTIKTIKAKYAVAEAKKLREVERKITAENEKREAYKKRKSKAFFNSNYVSIVYRFFSFEI